MKRARLAALSILLAAGIGAALLTFPSGASAWDFNHLPPGFSVVHTTDPNATSCPDWYVLSLLADHSRSVTLCANSPTFQSDLDAFVNANYTAPVTTTTAPPPVTTTVIITTPAATTTTVPTGTTAAPTAPVAQAPTQAPAPNTIAVTTTVTPVEQSLQAQIDALAAQIATLTSRVTRVEKAVDAAWLAFQQAAAAGSTVAEAAGVARSTYLDALYGLGQFAPSGG